MLSIARIDDLYDDGDAQLEGSANVFVNGLSVARVGDLTTGHPCNSGGIWPGVQIITGSSSVYANLLPIARVSDLHDTHCCGSSCHTAKLITGSNSVFSGG